MQVWSGVHCGPVVPLQTAGVRIVQPLIVVVQVASSATFAMKAASISGSKEPLPETWVSPTEIMRRFRVRRRSLYSHATATGLLDKRLANIKAALANVIERCSGARPSAAALVSACVALSKLNADGKTIERLSMSDGEQKFIGWTIGELQDFVRDGTLPARLSHPVLSGKLPVN